MDMSGWWCWDWDWACGKELVLLGFGAAIDDEEEEDRFSMFCGVQTAIMRFFLDASPLCERC